MIRVTAKEKKLEPTAPVVLRGKSRGKIWQKARGMWKDRQPDPIQELKKVRKELDRKLP